MKISAKVKAQHLEKFAPRENNPLYGIKLCIIISSIGSINIDCGVA